MSSFLSWSEALHQQKKERAWKKKEMARKKLWKENAGKKKSKRKEPNWKAPNSNAEVTKLLEEYGRRIETFSGSLANLDRGQRFVFMLEWLNNSITINNSVDISPFPYYFKAAVQHVDGLNRSLLRCLEDTNNNKFFMQSIKKNVTFQNPYFYHNDQLVRTKFHDFTDLLNNQSISSLLSKFHS